MALDFWFLYLLYVCFIFYMKFRKKHFNVKKLYTIFYKYSYPHTILSKENAFKKIHSL